MEKSPKNEAKKLWGWLSDKEMDVPWDPGVNGRL